jgi:hypothetical protein
MADSGFCSMSLDIAGVIHYARAVQHPTLLQATFPDLTDEDAQSILAGEMTINRNGNRLVLMHETNHAH